MVRLVTLLETVHIMYTSQIILHGKDKSVLIVVRLVTLLEIVHIIYTSQITLCGKDKSVLIVEFLVTLLDIVHIMHMFPTMHKTGRTCPGEFF